MRAAPHVAKRAAEPALKLAQAHAHMGAATGAAAMFGENTDEQPVLALALPAQAHKFSAQRNVSAARNLLRQVIAVSAASEVTFMGEPAKSALQRIGGCEDW